MYTLDSQLSGKRTWAITSNTKFSYMENEYEITTYSDGELIIYDSNSNNSIHFTPKNVDKLREVIDKLQNNKFIKGKPIKAAPRGSIPMESTITVSSLPVVSVYIPSMESSFPFPDKVSPKVNTLEIKTETDPLLKGVLATMGNLNLSEEIVLPEDLEPELEQLKVEPHIDTKIEAKVSIKNDKPKAIPKEMVAALKDTPSKKAPQKGKKDYSKNTELVKQVSNKDSVKSKTKPVSKATTKPVVKKESDKLEIKADTKPVVKIIEKAPQTELDIEKNTKGIMREVKGWGVNVMVNGKKVRYYYDTRAAARLADPKHTIGSNGRTS